MHKMGQWHTIHRQCISILFTKKLHKILNIIPLLPSSEWHSWETMANQLWNGKMPVNREGETASHIPNRCDSDRIQNTQYFMLTGRKPDLSKMCVFGSDYYAYKHDHNKLDLRCEKWIFVGYSKNSPAYLVYSPQTRKVSNHRPVKFIRKNSAEQHTQTDEDELEIDGYKGKILDSEAKNDASQTETSTENQTPDGDEEGTDTNNTEVSKVSWWNIRKGSQRRQKHCWDNRNS